MFRALLLTVVAATTLSAQVTSDADLKFEVASIKPNNDISPSIGGASFVRNGRFSVTAVPLRLLIAQAFGVQQKDQLIGGPSWSTSARYDITATTPLLMPTRAQQSAMLLNLLKDRFRLETHVEQRPIDAYELRLARADGKLGPGLRPFTADCEALRGSSNACGASSNGPVHTATGMPLRMLYEGQLPGTIERRIIDKTGLTGVFSWELQTQRDPNDTSAPSIFTALQEQLGLKLVPATVPLDVVVIDHIEPPTPN
jgi:uncharacterized protein (TIGR03435 family)